MSTKNCTPCKHKDKHKKRSKCCKKETINVSIIERKERNIEDLPIQTGSISIPSGGSDIVLEPGDVVFTQIGLLLNMTVNGTFNSLTASSSGGGIGIAGVVTVVLGPGTIIANNTVLTLQQTPLNALSSLPNTYTPPVGVLGAETKGGYGSVVANAGDTFYLTINSGSITIPANSNAGLGFVVVIDS